MCRYAALAIELCGNIKGPLTHTGSILDVKQCLVATYKWSLNKLSASVWAVDSVLAIGIAEGGEDVQSLGWGPTQIYLVGVCVRLAVGSIDVDIVCIVLLVHDNAMVELCAEVVKANGHILIVHSRECLGKRASCSQCLLHTVKGAVKWLVKNNAATSCHNADIICNDVSRAVTHTCRAAQNGCRGDVPLDVSARGKEVLAEVGVIVVASASNNGELLLDVVCVLSVCAHLAFVAIKVAQNIVLVAISPYAITTPCAVCKSLSNPARGCCKTCGK